LKWFLKAPGVAMHIVPNPLHPFHIFFTKRAQFQSRQGGSHLADGFWPTQTDIHLVLFWYSAHQFINSINLINQSTNQPVNSFNSII